jgi:hypothetical protein
VWVADAVVAVALSPRSHDLVVTVPVEVSLTVTASGAVPEVGETVNAATGATSAGTGVTGFDDADGVPVPATFAAATVNVYVAPFVRPATPTVRAVAAAGVTAPPGVVTTA